MPDDFNNQKHLQGGTCDRDNETQIGYQRESGNGEVDVST